MATFYYALGFRAKVFDLLVLSMVAHFVVLVSSVKLLFFSYFSFVLICYALYKGIFVNLC
jgi:hypothetical protein